MTRAAAKSRQLKGHDVEVVLGDLGEVERRMDSLPAGSRVAQFQRLGPWLVERDFLISLFGRRSGSAPAIPCLSAFSGFWLTRALLSPAFVRSTSRAQAVRFRRNVRAFYLLPDPITIKLGCGTASHQRIANELAARERAAGELRCPRVIEYALESSLSFVQEEMIEGRPPDRLRDRELVIDFVSNRLWSYYQAQGFELVRSRDLYDLDALLRGVREAVAAERDWDRAWLERDRFLVELDRLDAEMDKCLPCCFGHGDLSDRNMIVANRDGAIYLVDWERARALSVVEELRKIFLYYPGAWQALAPRLESLTEGRAAAQVVPVARQALLAVMAQIMKIRGWAPASGAGARERKAYERRRHLLLRRELAAANRLIAHGVY